MEIRRDRLTAVCPALYSAILYVQRGSAYLSSCPGLNPRRRPGPAPR